MTLFDISLGHYPLHHHKHEIYNMPYSAHVLVPEQYRLPNVEFGKTYFAPIQGALRAVRFTELGVVNGNDDRYMFLKGKAAGVAEPFVFIRCKVKPLGNVVTYNGDLYLSPEHYNNGDKFRDKITIIPSDLFDCAFGNGILDLVCDNKDIVSHRFDYICERKYHDGGVRYKWDGTKVVFASHDIVFAFNQYCTLNVLTKEVVLGYNRRPLSSFANYLNSTYLTYDECKAANSVKVIGFEDEPQPEQTAQLQVTISVTSDMLPQIVSLGAVVVA